MSSTRQGDALSHFGLAYESRFQETRRRRSDFTHLPTCALIEIEAGIAAQGRHNRAAGFAADLEQYLELASQVGAWCVSGRTN